MESAIIALVCVTVFGVVGILSAFIRQLLLSREKRLNDLAQQRALQQETHELEKIRQEMTHFKRFDAHYEVLGFNKDTIQYLDQRIEDILKQKSDLIKRYAESVTQESQAIIGRGSEAERKVICDKLKEDVDTELKFFESEIQAVQKRRASLWDNHKELLTFLVEQEKSRDQHLDDIYKQHSAMLEKVYLRHNENSEKVTVKTIDASPSTFKSILLAPIYFLMSFFKVSTNIDPDQAKEENEERDEIYRFEQLFNASGEAEEAHLITQSSIFARKKTKPLIDEEIESAEGEGIKLNPGFII